MICFARKDQMPSRFLKYGVGRMLTSKKGLSGSEKDFTFDRVQEIKPNKKRANWFHFYAD
jgi:hypothetical protein